MAEKMPPRSELIMLWEESNRIRRESRSLRFYSEYVRESVRLDREKRNPHLVSFKIDASESSQSDDDPRDPSL
jgi:hypothetical protein